MLLVVRLFAQDSNNISIVPVYCLLEDKLLQDL